MIKKMRKYAFMVYHKEYESFLSALQNLSVVHIQETKSIADQEKLQEIINQRKKVLSLIATLNDINKTSESDVKLAPARFITKEKGFDLVKSTEKIFERRNELKAEKQSLEKDMSYMEIWGNFSYQDIEHIENAGYDITFFTTPVSKFNEDWIDKYNAIIINECQSVKYFITVTNKNAKIDIDAERPIMPDRGLSKLKSWHGLVSKDLDMQERKILQSAALEVNTLIEFDKLLQNEFSFANVVIQTNSHADDKLMFLEGWITDEQAYKMEKTLDKDGFFYHQQEITDGENVPIELKNNRFTQLYEPITKMYSLPNYWEFDSTPLVAPFFMLFFGLCMGDAGYGLLIFIAATILKKKMDDSVRSYLTLFQYLGAAAMVLGGMSGSFFGISLGEVPFFDSVKNYFLSSDNLMTISIVIGIVHIIIAKIVAACKTKVQRGTKYSIAPFAWIIVIISLLCVFGLPMLDIHLPDKLAYVLYGIAGAGLLVTFLYNSPGKNIFLNMGSGLWDTYNMVTGLLGDVLSYIRLFAIGLTGAVLGSVFNSLAVSMTETMSAIPRFIVMLLILLVGHGISFALCMISSLVHPIRLIFVEYFKNAEFEGGGKAYSPFKKIEINTQNNNLN